MARIWENSALCLALASRFALAVVFLLAAADLANAAPLTFRFEAEVASVLSTNGGADLPITVSPGDLLVTTLTFEPGTGGPSYPQSSVLRFELMGSSLEVSEFEIVVANDDANGVDLNGRIADPINAPDVDLTGTSDNIFVSCLTGGPLFCGAVTGSSQLSFRPVLAFSNQDTLLTSNELLADPNVWNAFSFREMSLTFLNSNTGRETYVGAYIGIVQQVPEARTLYMALFGAVSCAAFSLLRTARPV